MTFFSNTQNETERTIFAFALVIGAGLCTTLGAAFAFCGKVTDHRLLACALGLAAGVMT